MSDIERALNAMAEAFRAATITVQELVDALAIAQPAIRRSWVEFQQDVWVMLMDFEHPNRQLDAARMAKKLGWFEDGTLTGVYLKYAKRLHSVAEWQDIINEWRTLWRRFSRPEWTIPFLLRWLALYFLIIAIIIMLRVVT